MRNSKTVKRSLFLIILFTCIMSNRSDAGNRGVINSRFDAKEMIDKADLVFLGKVENIEYVLSEPAGMEQIRIPYTFVTYRVEEEFKGAETDKTVVLRFIGGLNSETMLYLATSFTPQFDLGDRDILFVQGNAEQLCPLVGNMNGRLRIIRGKVYTENGRSILIGDNNELLTGKLCRLEEVMKTNVKGHEHLLEYEPDKTGTPDNAENIERVLKMIRSLSQNSQVNGNFNNANPLLPFKGPDMMPSPPPPSR